MGIMSHQSSSWYFFPMDKGIRHLEFTCKPFPWLSHWMVYGWGWAVAWRLSFSTMLEEATFVQLPLSMIKEHTFPWTVHREWKMLSLCSSFSLLRPLMVLLNTNNSPSSASSTTSSCSSSNVLSTRSSSSSSSLLASYLAKEIILLFGHSEAMCPSPWHWKHLFGAKGPGLGRFCGGQFLCGAWFFCGKEGDEFAGLGG